VPVRTLIVAVLVGTLAWVALLLAIAGAIELAR